MMNSGPATSTFTIPSPPAPTAGQLILHLPMRRVTLPEMQRLKRQFEGRSLHGHDGQEADKLVQVFRRELSNLEEGQPLHGTRLRWRTATSDFWRRPGRRIHKDAVADAMRCYVGHYKMRDDGVRYTTLMLMLMPMLMLWWSNEALILLSTPSMIH